jgi:hypothetical protein
MIAFLAIVVAPFVFWLYFWSRLPSASWSMDIDDQPWSFLDLFDRYQAVYKNVAVVAVGMGGFGWYMGRDVAAQLLFGAAGYAVLFQIIVIHCYEQTLHIKGSYGTKQYITVLTCGVFAVLLFVVGLAALAQGMRPQ